jgi:hypothetical protein
LNARILAWDRKTFHFPTLFFEQTSSLICFLCAVKFFYNFSFFRKKCAPSLSLRVVGGG